VGIVLNKLGRWNQERGQLPQADEYNRQAIAPDENTLGENSRELAGRIQNLGVVWTRQKTLTR
jgi:hypothetical protein